MGIFDMFKKKEEPVVETPVAPMAVVGVEPIMQPANDAVSQPVPVTDVQPMQQPVVQEQIVQGNIQQQPISQEPIVQQPIAQEPAQQPAPQSVVPLGQLPDNPFLEPTQPEVSTTSEINAVTPPSFDDIFNNQPQIIENPEPVQTENPEITIPNAVDTGAVVDEPKPIVEQQIALNVNPDEVFEGGLTKEDVITKIVAEQTNNEVTPQVDASNSNILNNVQQNDIVETSPILDNAPMETTVIPVLSEKQEPIVPIVQPAIDEKTAPSVPEIAETPVENTVVPEQNVEANTTQEVIVQPVTSVENSDDNVVAENVVEPEPVVEPTTVGAVETTSEVAAPVVEEKQENVEIQPESASIASDAIQPVDNDTVSVVENSTPLNNEEIAIQPTVLTEGEQQNVLDSVSETASVANADTPVENSAPMEENVSQSVVDEVKNNVEITPADNVSTEPNIDTNVEETVIQPTVSLETENSETVAPKVVTNEAAPTPEIAVSEATPTQEVAASPVVESTEVTVPENEIQEVVIEPTYEVQVTPEVSTPIVEEPIASAENIPVENSTVVENPAQIVEVPEAVVPVTEPATPVVEPTVQAKEQNIEQTEQHLEPVSVPVDEPVFVSQQDVNANIEQSTSIETNIPVSVTPPTINLEVVQPSKTIFCDNCGSIITDETAGVCPNCGEPIK